MSASASALQPLPEPEHGHSSYSFVWVAPSWQLPLSVAAVLLIADPCMVI